MRLGKRVASLLGKIKKIARVKTELRGVESTRSPMQGARYRDCIGNKGRSDKFLLTTNSSRSISLV